MWTLPHPDIHVGPSIREIEAQEPGDEPEEEVEQCKLEDPPKMQTEPQPVEQPLDPKPNPVTKTRGNDKKRKGRCYEETISISKRDTTPSKRQRNGAVKPEQAFVKGQDVIFSDPVEGKDWNGKVKSVTAKCYQIEGVYGKRDAAKGEWVQIVRRNQSHLLRACS